MEQPFDRPRARPGDAVLHFLDLLGDMDMDRPSFAIATTVGKLIRRHGPQAVRRDANAAIRQTLDSERQPSSSRSKLSTVIDEPALPLVRRRAAEGRMGIEDRQQRQADPRLGSGRGDPLRHFGNIGIGAAIDVVMQIVELADPRKACFQHFHIELAGNGFDMVGVIVSAKRYITLRQLQKLSAPGPRVSASPAMPRWKAWLCRFGMPGTRISWRSSPACAAAPASTGSDPASFERQPHILLPIPSASEPVRMNAGHWPHPFLTASQKNYLRSFSIMSIHNSTKRKG